MSKKFLYYKLELVEPAIIGYGTQLDNIIKSKDYIPGSTILGLFVSLYLRKGHSIYSNNTQNYTENFRTIFLSDKIQFYNAYPIYQTLMNYVYFCYPTPLSVLGCKYYHQSKRKPVYHHFKDYVFDDKILDECDNTNCKSALEHKNNFVYYDTRLRQYSVSKRIDMHNSSDDDLYSFEAIEKDNRFYGFISIDDDIYSKYSDLIRDMCINTDSMRIGKAKNRGYGNIEFVFPPKEKNVSFMKNTNNQNQKMLGIYCYSDVIIKNKFGQSISPIPGDLISSGLNLDVSLSYWKNDSVVLYNAKRRMPTEKQITIKKGSVFVYTSEKDVDVNKLPTSIGYWQNSGFGKLIYNHNRLWE